MAETVRVTPEPVEDLAGRLDTAGLELSELACRAQAARSAPGCVPAAARPSDTAGWCDQMADDLRMLVERARQVDDEAASAVSAAGLGGPWEPPAPGRNQAEELAGGAWDSLTGTAEAFTDLTVQLRWDPVGWWHAWGQVGEGMVDAVGNPPTSAELRTVSPPRVIVAMGVRPRMRVATGTELPVEVHLP